jgi:hypothetical protein
MDFKNNDFLMLVVAFLLGYFAHQIMKGCQIVEGLPWKKREGELEDRVAALEKNFYYNTSQTWVR